MNNRTNGLLLMIIGAIVFIAELLVTPRDWTMTIASLGIPLVGLILFLKYRNPPIKK